jgi:hypothetical protein
VARLAAGCIPATRNRLRRLRRLQVFNPAGRKFSCAPAPKTPEVGRDRRRVDPADPEDRPTTNNQETEQSPQRRFDGARHITAEQQRSEVDAALTGVSLIRLANDS